MSTPRTLIAASLWLGLAAGASAATLSFQQGMNGYAGTSDTNLREADATGLYGSELEVSIDASDDGGVSQALLRFDGLFGIGAGQIKASDTINSATLTLQITSQGSGISLHHMLVSWNQATATWNSLGNGIQVNGVEAGAAPFLMLGANNSESNVPSGPLVLDFTQALRQQQSGLVPGYGWALLPLLPNGTNGIDFTTAEGFPPNERPLLTVDVTPVPEPGTWALMAAGMAFTLGLARRRRQG
jgi:hypothetical protein